MPLRSFQRPVHSPFTRSSTWRNRHCPVCLQGMSLPGSLPACYGRQDCPRARRTSSRARYSNAPIGVNFLIAGYAYTRGGIAFGSQLPITNPDLNTSSAVVAYARVLDVWGMSAKFDAIVPYTWLSGTADYRGDTVSRNVNGFANSGVPVLDQSLRRARADDEGVRRTGSRTSSSAPAFG